jgi:hypothetical protein
MRTLQILSGFAVLLTTMAYGSLAYHYYESAPHNNPILWVGTLFAIVIGILSFVGGCLLLKSSAE